MKVMKTKMNCMKLKDMKIKLEYILSFNNKTKPKSDENKNKKKDVFDKKLYESREMLLNAFKKGLFPLKSTKGTGLKILTSKQMLQRLRIALAQVKAGNNSENLLNKSDKSFYQ